MSTWSKFIFRFGKCCFISRGRLLMFIDLSYLRQLLFLQWCLMFKIILLKCANKNCFSIPSSLSPISHLVHGLLEFWMWMGCIIIKRCRVRIRLKQLFLRRQRISWQRKFGKMSQDLVTCDCNSYCCGWQDQDNTQVYRLRWFQCRQRDFLELPMKAVRPKSCRV